MLRSAAANYSRAVAVAVCAPRHTSAATSAHHIAWPRRRHASTTSSASQSSDTEYDMGAHFKHTEAGGFVRHSSFDAIQLPNDQRIDQFVWRDMAAWQNHVAIACGESDRQMTFAQLRDRCAALAVRLQRKEFGLQAGDMVALCLPNSADFAIACFGAMEAGLTLTTVNPIYTADEIAKQLIASRSKVLIGFVEGYETLRAAITQSGLPVHLICVRSQRDQEIPDGAIDLAQLADPSGCDFSALRPVDTDPNGMAILPFSSGTTGLPKGVMLSHNNIVANSLQINARLPVEPLVRPTTADFQDVLPSILPFYHIYGLTVLLVSKLALGCKLVTLSKFAPDTFMRSLTEHRGTLLHMVPPMVNFLGGNPAVDARHLRHIRSLMSGAAPISSSDVERLMVKFKRDDVDFRQGFGMTESSPVCMQNVAFSTRYDSCGGPTPNTEVKIIDTADPLMRGLAANQTGEVLVRGPQIMLGYYENAEATAETLLADGWLRSGDMGHYDEQGYFYITDRLKELIKVKGFQVPPAELEALLRSHPLVADAGVVAVQHSTRGELPLAFVVRKAGASAAEASEERLQAFVAERVAVYKRLEGGVRFVDAIPKTSTGKILRRQLKADYL